MQFNATRRSPLIAGWILAFSPCATIAAAQDEVSLEERMKALEAENQQFRLDLDAMRSDAGAQSQPSKDTAAVNAGKSVRVYGFVRLDAYYQTARTNSIIIPAWVLPEGATIGDSFIEHNDDDFALDARLTRIGLDIDIGHVGDADVVAKIEADFANFPSGVAESRPTPRIRLAYADFDWGSFAIRAGQDWDVISPLYPAVNGEFLMWNAGNLGDRRPQIQGTWTASHSDTSELEIKACLGLTGAVDNADLDAFTVSSERDGFDEGLPHLQVRTGLEFQGSPEGKKTDVGLWGMIGGLETDTEFDGEDHFTTWTAGLDATVPITDTITLRGEQWVGQALSDHRGNIGQSINRVSGEEIQGWGGFGEIWLQATTQTRFHIGGSYDNPSDKDLVEDRTDTTSLRSNNWAAYVGTLMDWGSGVKTGLDVIFWRTDWIDEGKGDMYRFNAYVQVAF